jgi:hypothetical protein
VVVVKPVKPGLTAALEAAGGFGRTRPNPTPGAAAVEVVVSLLVKPVRPVSPGTAAVVGAEAGGAVYGGGGLRPMQKK